MQEQKLFKAVKYIDEELISEAADYKPNKNDIGIKAENAVYVAPAMVDPEKRKKDLFKYFAVAAVLLAVVSGMLFTVKYSAGIKNDLDSFTYTEGSDDWTELNKPVEPLMALETSKSFDEDHIYTCLYTDSLPEIPKPDFSGARFITMSVDELSEYYGYKHLSKIVKNEYAAEINDENFRYGIYVFPDGSIYDLNTFTVEFSEGKVKNIYGLTVDYYIKRFTVTIGKNTRCGQKYIPDSKYRGELTAYYNKEKGVFFSALEKYGLSFMFSAYEDEMYLTENPELQESFEKYNKSFMDENNGITYKFIDFIFFRNDNTEIKSFDEKLVSKYIDEDENLEEFLRGVKPVEPVKVIDGYGWFRRAYVDSLPEIPKSNFDEKYFIPMTITELFEYYGYYGKISELIENGIFTEITDEHTHYGIYKLPDGSVYDLNTFTFKLRDDAHEEYKYGAACTADRFTLTLAKETSFGNEYIKYNRITDAANTFYSEKTDTAFYLNILNGITFMFSGTIDDIVGADRMEHYKEKLDEERCCEDIADMINNTEGQFSLYYRYRFDYKLGWIEGLAEDVF